MFMLVLSSLTDLAFHGLYKAFLAPTGCQRCLAA